MPVEQSRPALGWSAAGPTAVHRCCMRGRLLPYQARPASSIAGDLASMPQLGAVAQRYYGVEALPFRCDALRSPSCIRARYNNEPHRGTLPENRCVR